MGWDSTTINGKVYPYYHQTLRVECGPASCITVGKLMGKGFSIDSARSGVRKNEMTSGGYNMNFNADYTFDMKSLTQVLSGRGISSAWHNKPGNKQNYLEILNKKVSASHPAILRVYHPYGHFVVCIGSESGKGTYYILDPEVPHRHMKFVGSTSGDFLGYQRPNGSWYYLDLHNIITT